MASRSVAPSIGYLAGAARSRGLRATEKWHARAGAEHGSPVDAERAFALGGARRRYQLVRRCGYVSCPHEKEEARRNGRLSERHGAPWPVARELSQWVRFDHS